MSNIVHQLRETGNALGWHSIERGCQDSGLAALLADEAADEIERLRARVAELEDALMPFAVQIGHHDRPHDAPVFLYFDHDDMMGQVDFGDFLKAREIVAPKPEGGE